MEENKDEFPSNLNQVVQDSTVDQKPDDVVVKVKKSYIQKYREDPEFREMVKQKVRERYKANKENNKYRYRDNLEYREKVKEQSKKTYAKNKEMIKKLKDKYNLDQ